MPIVIREMVTKVTITDVNNAPTAPGGGGGGVSPANTITPELKESIVRECIDQIMFIMRKNGER